MTEVETRADLAGAPPVVHKLVHWLETTEVPDGLFADDAFIDLTLPRWRVQAAGRDATVAVRAQNHPAPGTVTRLRHDPIPTGFVLEFEEEWDENGEHWYARELIRADVRDGSITDLSAYCTGDWDRHRVAEHRAAETLLRP
jgi:hypothetical protein